MGRLLILALAACHADAGSDAADSSAPPGDGGFCAVQEVLGARCVLCHSPAGGTQGELDLETDPIAATVNQPSPVYPGRTLVVPGDPDGSFLFAKVSGTQGADGDPMPAPSGLEAADVEVVRAWISGGAAASCDDTQTIDEQYHPAGWAQPSVHGLSAKLQEQDCQTCHGEDLTGGSSGVSCDSCHAPSWRTTCTYCHGGVENSTGAPPENIDDSTAAADLSLFPAHTAHVQQTIHPAFGCDNCHAEPTDPLSPGHIFVDDDTPGEAEVDITGTAQFSGGTCSNLYCHGDGQGPNGTADASFATTCHACHPDWTSSGSDIARMSGEHDKHVSDEGFDCSECHGQTVDASHQIVDPTVHVDGRPTVEPATITWNAANGTCQGTCHGEVHVGRHWN